MIHPHRYHHSVGCRNPTLRRTQRGSSGTNVVLVLVLVGLAAATIALLYWRSVGRAMQEQQPQPAAGPAPFDAASAQTELEALQEHFNQTGVRGLTADASLASVRRFVEKYPRFAPGRTLLAQVLIYANQLQGAYEQLVLSLDLDPNQPEVHLLAGTVACQLNRFDDATRHYSTAVGLEPSNARYRLYLAQVYFNQQKIEQARTTALEALRLDSSLHQAYALLADLYAQQNKLSLALTEIDHALAQAPATGRSTVLAYVRRKAQFLRRNNQPEESLLTLRSLGPSEQVRPDVLEDMAICWSMLGEPAKSAALFEDALAMDPSQWRFAAAAARWRLRMGDRDAAQRHLDTLRRINPSAPEIPELEAQLRGPSIHGSANGG